MERRVFPDASLNYWEEEVHVRRLIHLHFNLDFPLYPFCFEDVIRQKDNTWYDSPGASFLMIVALESGRSVYKIGGKQYTVVPGKVLLVPEFQPYYFASSGEQHKYVLEVKGCHLSSILSSLRLNRAALYEVEDFPAFLSSLKAIGERVDTLDAKEFTVISGECYELLMHLALQLNGKPAKATLLPRILEFLEQDFERKVSIGDLEEFTGISKMTLTRMVRKQTGMTPMQYRLSRKIERAIYYLQIPDISIKEIAYRLGFCNQFHFAKEFRRQMGRSPSEYRLFQKKLAEGGE